MNDEWINDEWWINDNWKMNEWINELMNEWRMN